MKKRYSLIAFLSILCLCSATIQAQTGSLEKPDAKYKLIRQQFKVNRDGTIEYNFRKEITLIRNRAITAYADKGETFIVYNPKLENLTINECYTIKKDGTKVKTPKRAFVEQLPSTCESCGRFNDIIELAIVHTALEYDCTIVLDYTISSKCDILQQKIQLTKDCPVEKYEIIVDQPFNSEFYYHVDANGANVKEVSDSHTLHIVGSNLAQTSGEHYLPAPEKTYPTVYFSNRESVANDMKQVRGKVVDAIPYINSERVRIRKLGNLSTHERNLLLVESLHNYVVDNIRCNKVSPALLGYKNADAAEVWRSGCGTPYEKAVVLAAVLQQAGFYAYAYLNEETVLIANEKRFKLAGDGEATVTVVVDNEKLDFSATHKNSQKAPRDEKTILKASNEGDNLAIYTIPAKDCPINIDPAYLTAKRTSPVQAAKCDEKYNYEIQLTEKASLVKPVEIAYSVEGLGSIKISIKQNGDRIKAVKELTIERDIIEGDLYADFRQMMIDWNQYNTIYLRLNK